jgi:hypothetical protein
MAIAQKVESVLVGAEKALAALASEAATATDYDAASCLIELAREVNALATKARGRLGGVPYDSASASAPSDSQAWTYGAAAIARSQPRGKPKKDEYPRFLREGEGLIKIGWSPSSRGEYEQKTPRKIIDLLAGTITKAGTNGRRFTMDRLLPLVDPDDGSRVPDYQAYIALAWLRQRGLVEQHGRQGYSLVGKDPLESSVNMCWAKLPTR